MSDAINGAANEITLIGIDCATDDAKVGVAVAAVGPGGCVLRSAGVRPDGREVADRVSAWVSESARTLVAIDAPLGWPRAMGTALSAHRAGDPLGVPANQLFRRETDRFVKARLGKQSLDVGADRIARTAHAALRLLADVRERTGSAIPLAWGPTFDGPAAAIEVYPAATLVAHGIPSGGYKRKDQAAARRAILDRLAGQIELPADRSAMEGNADALDAAVCVLAGFDFLRGLACAPDDDAAAREEGWIWVRTKTSAEGGAVASSQPTAMVPGRSA